MVKADRLINATDCADYLVKKGMPFRDAYKITGGLVARCIEMNTTLEQLPLSIYNEYSDLFDEKVYEAINLDNCVKGRLSYGGPAPQSVIEQIGYVRERL